MAAGNKVSSPVASLARTQWDVVVVGAGYAGFAAALAAKKAGRRTLLVDPLCDLLWESSLSRCPVLGKYPPEMRPFLNAVERATGIAEDWVDPGAAEWVANELLRDSDIQRLYYATPVAADLAKNGAVQRVTFALRNELVAISSAAWVDATDQGLLSRLCGIAQGRMAPIKFIVRLFLQNLRWPLKCPFEVFTGIYGTYASLEDSMWSSEKILKIEVGNAYSGHPLSVVEPFMKALRKRIDSKCSEPLVSHWSFLPYPIYPKQNIQVPTQCPNLGVAVPALVPTPSDTLGDRFALGIAAAERVLAMRKPSARQPLPSAPAKPVPVREIRAGVCVAGLGTAGLLATVAAARGGADTVAIEAHHVIGGIPTLGGMHYYYHGLPGGLQDKLDAEVRRLMPLFATAKQLPVGYHALARLVASSILAADSKAKLLTGSIPIHGTAEVKGGRLRSILASTPGGIVRIVADNWIDSTGDALLATYAGVKFTGGRAGDGLFNPFTQSWDKVELAGDDTLRVCATNDDHGFVDPLDSLDLTRARIESTHQLVARSSVRTSNAFNRTTGLWPVLGIRQGRLAATRYQLTIDDLVERRTFPDAVGITGGHLDTHLRDSFAEGDDFCFYLWCAGNLMLQTACEIPYRAILAEGIDNLIVACRAAGVDSTTCVAFRMQRDMQRIGEVAGAAAAIACKAGTTAADVPPQRLRAALILTGALAPWRKFERSFGEQSIDSYQGDAACSAPPTAANLRKWAASLGGANCGIAMWRLYRQGLEKTGPLLRPLLKNPGAKGGCAALVLGALGDRSAAARLEKSIADAGRGGDQYGAVRQAAVWALGRCAAPASLAVFEKVACDATLPPMLRLAALWCAAGPAARATLKATERKLVESILSGTRDLDSVELAGWRRPVSPWQRPLAAERLRAAAKMKSSPEDMAMVADSPEKPVRDSAKLIGRA